MSALRVASHSRARLVKVIIEARSELIVNDNNCCIFYRKLMSLVIQ